MPGEKVAGLPDFFLFSSSSQSHPLLFPFYLLLLIFTHLLPLFRLLNIPYLLPSFSSFLSLTLIIHFSLSYFFSSYHSILSSFSSPIPFLRLLCLLFEFPLHFFAYHCFFPLCLSYFFISFSSCVSFPSFLIVSSFLPPKYIFSYTSIVFSSHRHVTFPSSGIIIFHCK